MGALPCKALNVYTTNLNIIRYLTGSQRKSFITGEMPVIKTRGIGDEPCGRQHFEPVAT